MQYKCEKCSSIKFWFSFPTEDYGGLATLVDPICKSCCMRELSKMVQERNKTKL